MLDVVPEITYEFFIFPTMPCRFPDDIDRTVRMYFERGLERLVPMAYHREPHLYRYHSPGYVRRVVTDVDPKYHEHTCGMGMQSRKWVLSDALIIGTRTDTEEELWKRMSTGETYPEAYIEFMPFQVADCDTLDEWEFTQVVMEHYILKGRGRAVYDDYGATS